ncbi:MAG: RuvX/YqgF family protein, partial [Acidimicrobiales bacterium]
MRSAAAPIAGTGRVLGVDLGARRIGVAVCDDARRLATPVTVVARTADPAAHRGAIARLVAEYGAVGVVAGLPRSLSGDLGPAARAA